MNETKPLTATQGATSLEADFFANVVKPGEKVIVVPTERNPLDMNGLSSAEIELGVGFVPEMNFENTDDKAFFEDVNPAVTKANEIVTDLRLKIASGVALTPDQQARLDNYNGFISNTYRMRDEMARKEQEQMEAEAVRLANEAEAILSSTSSEGNVESVYEQVKAIVDKLGSRVSMALKTKLDELKKAIDAKSVKAETK